MRNTVSGTPSGPPDWSVLRRLLPYLWPKDDWRPKLRIVLAACFLAGSIAAGATVPFLLKHAVDSLDAENIAIGAAIAFVVAYGLGRVLQQGLAQARDGIFSAVGQRAARRVARRVFQRLHELSYRFHTERRTGALHQLIDRGAKAIDFLLRMALFNVVPVVGQAVIFLGILVIEYQFWFAVATFATVIAFIAFTFLVTEWRIGIRREMNRRDEEAYASSVDSLLNFETVRYFANEPYEVERFDNRLAGYEKAAVRSQVSLAFLNTGQGLIVATGLVIVMVLAARGVADGSMTIGDFVLINAFLIQLYMPLNMLGMVYREVKQSLVDMQKMFGLLDREIEVGDAPDAKPLAFRGGHIEFDNVTFGYDPRRTVLDGVSFEVPPGHTIAVVGESGGGKSTLTRLLFRFFDVTGGRILIDGQDIRDVTQASLRRTLGVVPQDVVLFNDTLEHNIRYGDLEAGDAQMNAAIDAAQLRPLIDSLPDGLASIVGERGLKLSGGEKQRVAIARMMLKDPGVMIFDEATSALDTATEREIQKALTRVSQGRTTLMIAHRLSTVVNADQIIVLDGGRIAERGQHHELIARNGLYAHMWRRQQAERAQDGEGAVSAAE
ncbi:ABCB family ABC transporter ATP-binding protein/permease [Minwuia thermotolerans]|uniref:ABCB family ABC transporter ATP-binding protein/permease n=1 Tax=Minwuia thermotolerans TaxID=2056226 RepID=UPI0019D0A24B|nr:ABC transporter ATP-binding protein/permease [Minwuia thermotolerans]